MTSNWALVQVLDPDASGDICVAVASSSGLRRVPTELKGGSLRELVRQWREWEPLLRSFDPSAGPSLDGVELVAPITYPSKVICAGANYYSHAEEMGAKRPDPSDEPYFFLKSPTTTIVGPDADVAISVEKSSQVDWEVELGVVIADRCRDVAVDDAMDVVAGYLVTNDLSDRGGFYRSDAVFPPFGFDWLTHKNQDGFCPTGPGLVPAWLVPDPHGLKMSLTVNGVIKQDSSTADMVVGIAKLIAAASRIMTLEPGDLILTGTPAGVGMPRQEFLKPGDLVSATIEGLGTLTNRVVTK